MGHKCLEGSLTAHLRNNGSVFLTGPCPPQPWAFDWEYSTKFASLPWSMPHVQSQTSWLSLKQSCHCHTSEHTYMGDQLYIAHVPQLHETVSESPATVTYIAPSSVLVSRGSPAHHHLGFSESSNKSYGAFNNMLSSPSPGGQPRALTCLCSSEGP